MGNLSILIFTLICFVMFNFVIYPKRYKNAVVSCAERFGLDKALVYAVIKAESNFNKNAKSPSGALGLMQIIPGTASYVSSLYNINYKNQDDLFNPEINIEIGTAYLRYLLNKFEDLETTLASYNAGETVIRSWLKNEDYSTDQKSLNYIPYKETRNYIKKIK